MQRFDERGHGEHEKRARDARVTPAGGGQQDGDEKSRDRATQRHAGLLDREDQGAVARGGEFVEHFAARGGCGTVAEADQERREQQHRPIATQCEKQSHDADERAQLHRAQRAEPGEEVATGHEIPERAQRIERRNVADGLRRNPGRLGQRRTHHRKYTREKRAQRLQQHGRRQSPKPERRILHGGSGNDEWPGVRSWTKGHAWCGRTQRFPVCLYTTAGRANTGDQHRRPPVSMQAVTWSYNE